MEWESYSIGKIAKLFQIPASTLRYWETKEVFSSKRNEENDYREFTIQTAMELLDVIFYRNLNVPIQKMKHFSQLNPEQIYSILEDTEQEVQQELESLKKKSIGISQRKEQLESLFSLKQRGYQEESLSIKKIVPFDMMNQYEIQVQLEHLANFVLYKDNQDNSLFQMGIVVPDGYKKKSLWENNDESLFITCLLECDSEDFEKNNFEEHELAMKKLGYSIKQVIAPFLATASGKEGQSLDYYKAWLEITPL